MITCETCEHGIFCEGWGEWKCKKKSMRIHNPDNLDCPDYKKSKEKRPYCSCDACVSGKDDE